MFSLKTGGHYSLSGSRWCFLEAKESSKEEDNESQSPQGVRCRSKEMREIGSLASPLRGKWRTFAEFVPCWPILHWHALPGPAVRLKLSISTWHLGQKGEYGDYGASDMRFQICESVPVNLWFIMFWMPSCRTYSLIICLGSQCWLIPISSPDLPNPSARYWVLRRSWHQARSGYPAVAMQWGNEVDRHIHMYMQIWIHMYGRI